MVRIRAMLIDFHVKVGSALVQYIYLLSVSFFGNFYEQLGGKRREGGMSMMNGRMQEVYMLFKSAVTQVT